MYFYIKISVQIDIFSFRPILVSYLVKELRTYRGVVKVRKSCEQMTLPMIQIGPKLHQMTSELWDSINAIQNPYSLVR